MVLPHSLFQTVSLGSSVNKGNLPSKVGTLYWQYGSLERHSGYTYSYLEYKGYS
jgi:hypothetical protein